MAVSFEFTQMCIDFTALFFAVRFADKKGSAQRTTFIRKKRSGLRMNGVNKKSGLTGSP